MQAKSKWIAALASFCAVMVVAIVSMGIIWAASSQQVQTSVNITYTVSGNVICDVSASKYMTSSNTKTDFVTSGADPQTTITFNAADASTVGVLTITDTTLTTTDQVVVFEYVLSNKNASAAMNAALATGSATNLTFYTIAPQATRKTNVVSTFDASEWTVGNSIAATTIPAATNASTPTTYYAYVAVKVTDLNQAASFSGNFTWTIAAGAAA